MRVFIASIMVVLAVASVASADEYFALVRKFENGKITFMGYKQRVTASLDKIDQATFKVADNVKFFRGKTNFEGGRINIEAAGDYEGGKDAFAKAVKMASENKKVDTKKDKVEDLKGAFLAFEDSDGVFAQIITQGTGENLIVTEIRVIQEGTWKGKK